MPPPQKIIELYAWIAEEADGSEGIAAAQLPNMPGWTPLIGADRARIESYRGLVQLIADTSARAVTLKSFGDEVVIDKVLPRKA